MRVPHISGKVVIKALRLPKGVEFKKFEAAPPPKPKEPEPVHNPYQEVFSDDKDAFPDPKPAPPMFDQPAAAQQPMGINDFTGKTPGGPDDMDQQSPDWDSNPFANNPFEDGKQHPDDEVITEDNGWAGAAGAF